MSLKPRQVDFQETWQNLRETVRGVVGLRTVERAVWNNRFSDVYALCVAYPEPLADRLYDETKTFLEEHVATLLERVRGGTTSEPDHALLQRYHDAWAEYSQGVEYLNALYSYLNLQHIKRQKVSDAEIIYGSAARPADEPASKLEVGELGLRTWERVLVRPLATALTTRVLRALEAARDDTLQGIHERTLRAVIHSLVAVRVWCANAPLALYAELVEAPYLAAAQQRHARAAAELLARNDLSHYMREALRGLERETALAARLLHSSSLERARAAYERAAVAAHAHRLHAECARLVREQQRADLRNAYALLRPLGPGDEGTRPLVEAARDHAAREVRTALQAEHAAESAPQHFVHGVLTVHARYAELYSDVFGGDQAFLGALDKACSAVVNARPADQACRSPELLARYCDQLLRRRAAPVAGAVQHAATDAEADEKLAAAILVFKYIDDKDIFQKYYARALARRLIHQLSASMELEEAMINRLKAACGYEFTNKLHRMFTDVAVSHDLNAKFNEHLRATNVELGMGLTIQVLQAGAWPLGGAGGAGGAGGTPAAPLARAQAQFEEFYRAHFSGRRLTWLHALCTGELRTRYTERPYMISLAAPQCALLLSWDAGEALPLSVRDLRAQHQLSRDTFLRHARPLVDARLLDLSGDLDDETESCTLVLKLDFKSKRTKIRITCAGGAGAGAPGTGGAAPAEEPPAHVDDDRKMYLQAAIVRIMKSRKVMRHNELIQEVCAQARSSFAPSVAMIKKCIEALIDKAYLERSPAQPDTYSYVA